MGFIRRTFTRRFPLLGRLGDVAIVGGTALRFANRRGLISDDMAKKFGAPTSSAGSSVSAGEIALAVAAAYRLATKARTRRSS